MAKEQHEIDLKRCRWQMMLYDNRRNDTTVSDSQRKIAEKWYQVYRKLYNEMKKKEREEN